MESHRSFPTTLPVRPSRTTVAVELTTVNRECSSSRIRSIQSSRDVENFAVSWCKT